MQDNYKEILQAVIEGKQLQFKHKVGDGNTWKDDYENTWKDDYENNGSNERITQIIKSIHSFDSVTYRVKPEKKVFKYQTRSWLNTSDAVIIWTSTDYFSLASVEEMGMFNRWLEPVQDHEVVYE